MLQSTNPLQRQRWNWMANNNLDQCLLLPREKLEKAFLLLMALKPLSRPMMMDQKGNSGSQLKQQLTQDVGLKRQQWKLSRNRHKIELVHLKIPAP